MHLEILTKNGKDIVSFTVFSLACHVERAILAQADGPRPTTWLCAREGAKIVQSAAATYVVEKPGRTELDLHQFVLLFARQKRPLAH